MRAENLKTIMHPKIVGQLGLLIISFWVLFGQTLTMLIQDWSINDNYSHGFLVPFIAGYMIWQKKDVFPKLEAKQDNYGLLILLIGMAIFVAGNIGAELFIKRTAVVITITAICYYFLGRPITVAMGVPLAYLMFMIPLPAIIWNKIAFPLQLFAANLTSGVIQSLGIPLLREGNILHLPNTTLEVVDACSGIRSLTTLLALSAAFAFISSLSRFSKLVLFFSAIPIAIFVNVVRLTFTALLARYVGPETAHGFLHDISGILVFFVALILLFGLHSLLKRIEANKHAPN